MRLFQWLPVAGLLCLAPPPLRGQEGKPAATFLVDTLPAYEKAAADCVRELQKHQDSRDPKVVAAVQGARFRANLFLRARANLQRDPRYLRYLTTANLKLWQEGMDHFSSCAPQAKDPYEDMVSGLRV